MRECICNGDPHAEACILYNQKRNSENVNDPTPQDVSNFLYRAERYLTERNTLNSWPVLQAIQILHERCYDVMDAEVGRLRALAVQ